MKRIDTDVLVIGSGGAGLYAAVRAAERGVRVLLADKGLIAKSGATVCAAGLTAVGPWHVSKDSQEVHFQDTLAGGHFINNQRLVRILIEEAGERVMELKSWGLVFDHEKDGRYFLDQVSGHTYPRALARSDRVGMGIAKLLWRRALQVGVVTKAEIFATSLLTWEGGVVGVTAIDSRSGKFLVLTGKAVVLATGGIGQLYPVTTNPVQATGDGLALALKAGAALIDMEQVQFVPPCLVYPESVKGFPLGVFEYAKMLDNQLQVICDPVKSKRLTRDVLSQKIYAEIKAGCGTEHGGVYLDARRVPEEVFRNFRHEYEFCLERGLNLHKELVEVAPAAHFLMGGIEISERCETGVLGLYAAGEVTGGVHGANRLSGNALADILVFGARAGEQAAKHALGRDPVEIDHGEVDEERQRISVLLERGSGEKRPIQVKEEIRQIMWKKVGVMRRESSLTQALERFDEIELGLPEVSIYPDGLVCNRELTDYLEAENMLLVAKAIASSGLARKESRGAHHLEDHPERGDLPWLKNIVLKLEDGRIKTSIKPVVTEIW